ncbi:MAG TPA: O-antigen ligase family protein [Bryobacteraceae bacterium]
MTNAHAGLLFRQVAIAAALGCCAAAIALAPASASLVVTGAAALIPLVWWTLAAPGRWIAAFLISALILPPLPIALGNTGPHPALIFGALGLFAGLMRMAEWSGRPTSLDCAIASYFLILMASLAPALWHAGAAIAAASFARVLLFGLGPYVYFYSVRGPTEPRPQGAVPNEAARELADRRTRIFFLAGTASALLACLDFYFQFPAPSGFSPQFVWLASGVYRRAQGVFYEASTLGNLSAFFLVMIAVAVSLPGNASGVRRRTLLLGAPLFAAALIFSYSRASVLNLVVAFASLLFLRRARIGRGRLVGIILALVLTSVVIVYFVFPGFYEAYVWRWWNSAAYLLESPAQILSGRWATWSQLAVYALQNPLALLTGVGYKTLPYSNLLGDPLIADNMYLSVLVEAGVMGLAALLWMNIAILRAGYRAAHHPDPRTRFYGSWIFCFWMGEVFQMASGDLLTYWRVLPLYFWVLALAVRGAERTGRRARPQTNE